MNRESLHRESGAEQNQRISTFEDLEVYQAAREFRKATYKVEKHLPDIEKFGLPSQMRRGALSLTDNTEGHGRYHYPDQIRFMLQLRGSLEELIDDLITCNDGEYLATPEISALKKQGWRVRKLSTATSVICAIRTPPAELQHERISRITAAI